jgi:hypothetical protein
MLIALGAWSAAAFQVLLALATTGAAWAARQTSPSHVAPVSTSVAPRAAA